MWYYATFLYFVKYYQKDPRERTGLEASAVADESCYGNGASFVRPLVRAMRDGGTQAPRNAENVASRNAAENVASRNAENVAPKNAANVVNSIA
ncbi:hypothetical protein DVH24_027556 [Malus domestica]|uniref:Uncharacterized protein n=1 Tax=Malus domestica TaxID=3750 RepID=A0A498H8U3_MALDO|nr:hypothetical protein DVH24_027556 [Malus domestica]